MDAKQRIRIVHIEVAILDLVGNIVSDSDHSDILQGVEGPVFGRAGAVVPYEKLSQFRNPP
ncbi:MAG: hypothetical protein ACO3QV_07180 [Candidatus Nanopelagicaceae bacterium]